MTLSDEGLCDRLTVSRRRIARTSSAWGKTHAVESHEDGRRRQLTRLFVEEVEPRDELLIETRDLTDRKSCVQGFRSDLARGVGHGLRKAV